jgi:hypothetical protein
MDSACGEGEFHPGSSIARFEIELIHSALATPPGRTTVSATNRTAYPTKKRAATHGGRNSDQHGTNFTVNEITIRAEERLALCVRAPLALITRWMP